MTIASSKTPIGANAASHTETMTKSNFMSREFSNQAGLARSFRCVAIFPNHLSDGLKINLLIYIHK